MQLFIDSEGRVRGDVREVVLEYKFRFCFWPLESYGTTEDHLLDCIRRRIAILSSPHAKESTKRWPHGVKYLFESTNSSCLVHV